MAMSPEGLQHGQAYFALFYAENRRDRPIVETFVFIGSDFRPDDTRHDTVYIFQLARSFYQQGDWNQMTMDERDQYTDAPVVTFDAQGLAAIHDAASLAAELGRR
jgi:hypothetical protein